ncbi:hypothetical protein ZHAS_00013067 [Anopheles sinensis]|uniref:Uncharacterized protein n=1 Tax=Anopheles sinensis TaxID=74873 RepID=A0A084W4T7_ANOSI|nr:hypothetical protein ZHAS_00013067 [Anopheles sinensis]
MRDEYGQTCSLRRRTGEPANRQIVWLGCEEERSVRGRKVKNYNGPISGPLRDLRRHPNIPTSRFLRHELKHLEDLLREDTQIWRPNESCVPCRVDIFSGIPLGFSCPLFLPFVPSGHTVAHSGTGEADQDDPGMGPVDRAGVPDSCEAPAKPGFTSSRHRFPRPPRFHQANGGIIVFSTLEQNGRSDVSGTGILTNAGMSLAAGRFAFDHRKPNPTADDL